MSQQGVRDERGEARALVVVGASAGGVEALRDLFARLPADISAAVLVVLHMAATGPSALPAILSRVSRLPVAAADDGSVLRAGQALVAPPDHHLMVRDGRVRLGRGPRENGHRPAVDPLFRSAARWYGSQAVAVVLSGSLDDGAAGAATVAAGGGAVLVQRPEEALFSGMPSATLLAVPDARSLPIAALCDALVEITGLAPHGSPTDSQSASLVLESDMAGMDEAALQEPRRPESSSGLSCPECHGVLFEIPEERLLRYRCRVGHAWSPESLLVRQDEEVETALWVALRTLEERAALHRRVRDGASEAGRRLLATASDERATEAVRSAEMIRDLLLTGGREVGADGEK